MAKLTELAHESPATPGSAEHVHVASTSHWRLRRIARKAVKHFGLTVHEFPASKWAKGDCLDGVHAVGSWHYRKKGDPWTPRGYDPSTRCRLKNLALDAFGPIDKERAFYHWVHRKYGRPSGWHVPF